MATTKVTVRLSEVPRNVVNHAGRGDARGVPTRAELNFQRDAEKKTTEQLRAEADAKLKAAHWKVLGPEVEARISAVLARYPWYRDTPKNAQVITAKLSSPEAVGLRRRQPVRTTICPCWK